jgi:hypothetical protein
MYERRGERCRQETRGRAFPRWARAEADLTEAGWPTGVCRGWRDEQPRKKRGEAAEEEEKNEGTPTQPWKAGEMNDRDKLRGRKVFDVKGSQEFQRTPITKKGVWGPAT